MFLWVGLCPTSQLRAHSLSPLHSNSLDDLCCSLHTQQSCHLRLLFNCLSVRLPFPLRGSSRKVGWGQLLALPKGLPDTLEEGRNGTILNGGTLSDIKGALFRPRLSVFQDLCCAAFQKIWQKLPRVALPSTGHLRISNEMHRFKGSQCLLCPIYKGDNDHIEAVFVLLGQLWIRTSS